MSPEIIRGPISPGEVVEFQNQMIPEEVFVVFNGLLSCNLRNGRAKVLQCDVLQALTDQGMNKAEIFKKHWLDVEESYRAKGWQVTYDSPVGYAGESFEPYFEFRAPKGVPKMTQEYY